VGLFADPALARTPLAEVASAWLDSNPGKRDGSWQRDEIVVRRHIVPALGSRAIGSLTPADIQGTVNRWVAKVSPGTVRRKYCVLRAIVNYAVANDMLGRSPSAATNGHERPTAAHPTGPAARSVGRGHRRPWAGRSARQPVYGNSRPESQKPRLGISA
jgi:hypothetical protein